MIVSAHEEPEWPVLAEAVTRAEGASRAAGHPAGGGAVVHADLSVEPVRRGLLEVAADEGVVRRARLCRGEGGEKKSQRRSRRPRPSPPLPRG